MSFRLSISVCLLSLFSAPSLMILGCTLDPERVEAPAVVAEQDEIGSGYLARAQRHIEEREYWASENGEGLQAPNRRHNLRTYFEPTGIRVHDRTRAGSPELLSLTLNRVGRDDALAGIEPGKVSGDGSRVEIKRPGLVEWYENSQAGLEQGFTLTERPAGVGPLRLELMVAGGEAALRGDDVVFKTARGRRLRYSKLVATDTNGAVLVAHMEVPAPDRIQLWVDDTNAVYPLTIDPILTAMVDTQLESDQENGDLGFSVSGAGDVNGDGYADVIVGAFAYDAGQSGEGAAFIFLGSAAGIADGSPATAAAQLESNQADASFGFSVSGAGDVNGDGYADVIVSAHTYNAGGAAFVFLGSAVGIVDGNPATAAAQLESDQASANFGRSVSGAGDVNGDGYADVIVGAVFYDAGATNSNEGAAFVFLGSPVGIADGNPATAAARLVSDEPSAMGRSVSGAGDVNGDGYADVIVGAPSYDAGNTVGGAAFIFLGSAAGIADGGPATAAAQLDGDQLSKSLGISVSGAGDVNGDGYADVIVASSGYDTGFFNEGAAFIFLGSAAGIADGGPATAATHIETNQADAGNDIQVSGAGDINGDGYADVIVGVPRYAAGEHNEGAAFIFLGSAAGIADGSPATAAAHLELNQEGANFGRSVSGAGDVNGDGYADVIVGANNYSAGQENEGAAFVYLGGAQIRPVPALGLVGIAILLGLLGTPAYWRLRVSASSWCSPERR